MGMNMDVQKIFFALKDPLSCLAYTKKLILANNTNSKVTIILPKHIDPSKLEELLLRDRDFVDGINIYGISSFPQSILRAKAKLGLKQKVDQIKLSEHFHNLLPRNLCRPLLNTVLELKNANFEDSYIELLNKRKEKEGQILLEVFREYQKFLKDNDVWDTADYKRALIDEILDLNSNLIDTNSTYIFAGFNEFTSYDLEIIGAVSKKALNTFVVSPDIFNTDTDYSKILKEEFLSLYFTISDVKDTRTTKPLVHEFQNINDELYYAATQLGKDGGAIYAISDVDMYYALLRYHFGENKVSISSAIRLDRTSSLNILCTLISLNLNEWTYDDVTKILNFKYFWEDNKIILKFINKAKQGLTLPRGHKAWLLLTEEKEFLEIKRFFENIVKTIPLKAYPNDFNKALKLFTNKLNTQKSLELKSIINLIDRVTESLDDKIIDANSYVRKIYNHAEENYVEKGPINFKPLHITLASLCSANTAEKTWFVGSNQEAIAEMKQEDVVMNDNFILAYRSEGFIYPSSKETTILSAKIIQDACKKENSSYISSIGPAADILKGIDIVKNTKTAPKILESALSELTQQEIKIVHKYDFLSASLIETYMKCPYICFAERLLKTQRQNILEFGLSPIDAGRLLHTALEVLLPKKLKDKDIDVEQEMTEIFIIQHPLKNVFLKYYSSIIKKILDAEFKYMKEKGLEIFKNTELKFKVSLDITNGIPLHGTVDRIDIDKKNNKLYIADYKTSNIPSKTEVNTGKDIQLAIYIMAIANEYPNYDGYNAYYISIKKHEHSELELASLEEVKKLFSIYGVPAVKGLIDGSYSPQPMNIEDCEKCDYRRCCGTV